MTMTRAIDAEFTLPSDLRYCILDHQGFDGQALKVYEQEADSLRATDSLICTRHGSGANILTSRQYITLMVVDLWIQHGGWIPAHAREELAAVLGIHPDQLHR